MSFCCCEGLRKLFGSQADVPSLVDLRRIPKPQWQKEFTPLATQVSEADWAGDLIDLFSPDYESAERKPWDKNPDSRRFIDLRNGQLQCSEDLGKGKRSGRRFDPSTTSNPTLTATGTPNQRHMSFATKVPKSDPKYAEAQAGALLFTCILGMAFGRKVIKINTLYDGKGGPWGGFDAPPGEFNFWLYVATLAELRLVSNRHWLQAFKPIKGQVSDEDWTGELVDLFSPNYESADREPWDTNPDSRRFIDLRVGQLQESEDLGNGKRSGRRFDLGTTVNPLLTPMEKPNERHMSFACKVGKSDPKYAQVQAGALEFTGVLGMAFGRKVIKLNTLYDGKGGPFGDFVAPPREFNFWLFVAAGEK